MCAFVYFAPSHIEVMQALKVVQPSTDLIVGPLLPLPD